MEPILIALDAGHGSQTAGKRTPPVPENLDFENDGVIDVKKGEPLKEHIANVGVCRFLEKEFLRCGFAVLRSGYDDGNAYDDADVPITQRQKLIREANASYSVSVHFNAFGDGRSFNSANGISTYIHAREERIRDSERLAWCVQQQLKQGSNQRNRGVNNGPFGMVNCIGLGTKASVLVELAFMTNEYEAINYVGNSDFWKECAIEICKGFCDYLSVPYIPEKRILYTVQAGAFLNAQNARNMVDRVRAYGFGDAYIRTAIISEKKYYRVQIGVYAIKQNAIRVVEKLTSLGIPAYYKEL